MSSKKTTNITMFNGLQNCQVEGVNMTMFGGSEGFNGVHIKSLQIHGKKTKHDETNPEIKEIRTKYRCLYGGVVENVTQQSRNSVNRHKHNSNNFIKTNNWN